MDESTTDPATPATGAELPAQPVEPQPDPAVTQPAEPTTPTPEPSTDDNSDWLKTKGIDPSDPDAVRKLADMARNAEKKMHETTAKASDLEKSIRDASATSDLPASDEMTMRLARVELALNVDNFFKQEGIDAAMRPKMAEFADGNPNIARLVEEGALTLRDLYNMTLGSDPNYAQTLKATGGKEALQDIASKQTAQANPGIATSSQMAPSGPTKATAEEWYRGLSADERAKPENQRILNDLLSS